jgi:hypothetical protein
LRRPRHPQPRRRRALPSASPPVTGGRPQRQRAPNRPLHLCAASSTAAASYHCPGRVCHPSLADRGCIPAPQAPPRSTHGSIRLRAGRPLNPAATPASRRLLRQSDPVRGRRLRSLRPAELGSPLSMASRCRRATRDELPTPLLVR